MNESYAETQTPLIAHAIAHTLTPDPERASVVCLKGDLGAGKTTLVQAIALEFGVDETVVSPTFVIAKFYTPTKGDFARLVHIDAYRIESEDELGPLGFEALLTLPNTLVIIEWPERIARALPSSATWYVLTHSLEGRHIATA